MRLMGICVFCIWPSGDIAPCSNCSRAYHPSYYHLRFCTSDSSPSSHSGPDAALWCSTTLMMAPATKSQRTNKKLWEPYHTYFFTVVKVLFFALYYQTACVFSGIWWCNWHFTNHIYPWYQSNPNNYHKLSYSLCIFKEDCTVCEHYTPPTHWY